ncbi:LexA family transcriptional regulator [Spirosoma sp. BT702]|uniref:LexA family transcriptional regulator n=1 Tax=Spirosoma profusum TaxID=2771354 RepID=A0A926XY00_9BACT|nr:LexA family transcriptional regulator [Spirosoma profusum]MBD2700097.1 LexA family transcriptional regulator [Spirosoma profusum]
MPSLPEMIKSLRLAKGLTQGQLAAVVGLGYQSVQKWETGRGRPTTAQLPSVARALGVSINELIQENFSTELDEPGPGIFATGNIASVRPNIKEYYVQVPFLSARAQAGIPVLTYETFTTWIDETYPVFLPTTALKTEHLAIEVVGDSMEPGIISRAVVLGRIIKPDDIKYESGGVYAVLYAGNRFVLKRIRTNEINTNGTLTLWSDNQLFGNIILHAEDIICMWKITEKVWEPVR